MRTAAGDMRPDGFAILLVAAPGMIKKIYGSAQAYTAMAGRYPNGEQ